MCEDFQCAYEMKGFCELAQESDCQFEGCEMFSGCTYCKHKSGCAKSFVELDPLKMSREIR